MLKLNVKKSDEVLEAFKKALEIAERIRACNSEYQGFITGVEGSFIEPGPSGSITRGKVDILPTGRNFYAVNPASIPTRSAWKIGVETAERLLKYYVRRHGRYPESVGHWLWSLDGYKADGEQLSQILYLFGTQPVWAEDGSVKGVEIIPLEKLGRPRIDNTVRISGIVRDTLPNYFHLIDEAVSKVAVLDEPLELNYVKKHYLEFLDDLARIKRDVSEDAARCRVWCSPPGTYGAGVNYAIEASAWKTDEDLAKTWVQWGCYMYTRNSFGKPSPEGLILNLKKVDVVTRNHVSDEHDIFNCCCYFSYQGGLYNTAKNLTGKQDIEIIIVDTKDITSAEIRGMKEEIERIVRAKLLNPIWINGMKKHGYRGANEFSRKILHLYGWSATTKLVENWVFNEIAETYIINEEMRRWFKENNVWAAEEIARRLVEAAERGLWRPSEEMLEQVKDAYADIEGVLEENIIGESAIQGSAIRVYTAEEVENWRSKLTKITEAWKMVADTSEKPGEKKDE